MHRNSPENSDSFIQYGPVIPLSFNINILYTGYEKCDPLHFAGPCYKSAYLMHIVLNGKGRFCCNGKEYPLQKGDIFLITPSDYIFYQSDEKEPLEYRWVKFAGTSPKYLFENAKVTKQVYSVTNEEQFCTVRKYFEDIFELMHDEVAPYFRATGMFYLFLGWFLKTFGESYPQTEDKMSFVKILNYINNHFLEEVDMNKLASVTNYNRSHIYKMFMKNLGCSPKDYINSLRLNHACEMLLETDYSITDISLKAGFKNYISFVTAFKKKYGLLPNRYRTREEQNKKGIEI